MPIEFSQNSTARLYQTLCVVTSIIVMCVGSSAQQSSEEVKTGTISGRVVNENGQPLVGATVSISQAGTVSSGRSTISNLEGNFQVNGLENALYYVSANSPAYVTAPLDLETPYPTYRVGDSVQIGIDSRRCHHRDCYQRHRRSCFGRTRTRIHGSRCNRKTDKSFGEFFG